jgi:meso-butanediol dehydrogenase/(S,S)-butanediol dehydrogenase/diacetyl reductase
MLADLTGKVAIVTGGGGGIGRGIATVLARCGARIAVADVRLEVAEHAVADLIRETGSVMKPFSVDVTDVVSVDRLIQEVIREFATVDILVNNAGVHGAPGFEDVTSQYREEDWDVTFAVNVKGTLHVTEAVIPEMTRKQSGKIVNISSHSGRGELPSGGGTLAAPSGGAYGASKAAIIYLTQTYAIRLGPQNINVNCICPGSVFTPLWEGYGVWAARNIPAYAGLSPREVYERTVTERAPLGRPQTPEDVGNAVAFLASEEARNITGQALNVNGGQRMN